MKRNILILAGLLASATLFSQVQTTISGKVHRQPGKPVILLVYNFNTAKMVEEETMIQSVINADSTFSISTDQIKRPFTNCRIGFNNEGQKIILSPGDSLRTEFSYGSMDTTIIFSGENAGINEYLTEYQLDFSEKHRPIILQHWQPDSASIDSLTSWKDRKIAMLNSYLNQGKFSASFMTREQKRIHYDFFNDLLERWQIRDSISSADYAKVTALLGNTKFTDDNSLMDSREYRWFILSYIDFKNRMLSGSKANLQHELNRINVELTGLTRTYCSFFRIKQAISEAPNGRKKMLLRNYFIDNSNDAALIDLLKSLKIRNFKSGHIEYARIAGTINSFFMAIGFLALLFSVIYLIRGVLLRKTRKVNSMVIAKVIIYLLSLIAIFVYLSGDKSSSNRILALLRVLTILAFTGIQVFWLIPVWFSKGKLTKYGLFLSLISLVYSFVLLSIGRAEHYSQSGNLFLDKDSAFFIVNSWIVLVPFSFLNYYINLLIKKNKEIDYLVKEKLLSLEVSFHVVFLMILLSALIPNYFRYTNHVLDFVMVISGLAIFYFQIFFLIPNYLLNKKPGIYALGCLVLLIGTLILIYLINIVELYLSMSGMGIRLTFLRFFSMPEPILLLTAAALQIIIVPALIYAFIKDLLKQKTIGFKLFRNKEAELQQLRSQVNPHFLFNSLNTLYAFALKENNTKTAEYIAKLANLMRYLVDDMEKAKIPVQKEISYIRDYINLQAIRSSVEHNIDINIAIDEDQNIMIAPMLMIPFVENAFKHGINPNSISELKVTVQITDHQFQFVIENSVDRNFEAFYKEKGFGIGIANVRQRLEHIYPGKHTLSVADTADRFIVIMTIALMEMGEITI